MECPNSDDNDDDQSAMPGEGAIMKNYIMFQYCKQTCSRVDLGQCTNHHVLLA